jgi:4-amino-4-deoxy-L-arabinose transferase-like glycosyltransferase
MLSRLPDQLITLLLNKGHFLRVVFIYLVILFFFRVALFPGASEDDAEQLIYAQMWAWGYKANQPPLYTWLVILSQYLFGVSIFAVEAVKFVCLFMLYGFLTSVSFLIVKDRLYSMLCGLSLIGIYHVGWDVVMNYSNTALLGAAVAASFWALFRLLENPSRSGYVWLGLTVGIGMLSKYNFAFVLVPMVIAGLMTKDFRARLCTPQILISLVIIGVLITPHYYWYFTDPSGMQSAVINHQQVDPSATYFSDVGKGLWSGARAIVAFLVPFAAIALLIFWRPVLNPGSMNALTLTANRFVSIYFVSFIGLAFLGVVAFQLSKFQNHWMMVLIPAPLFLVLRLHASKISMRRLGVYASVLSFLAVAVYVGVGVRYATGPLKCRKCNFFIPYAELAAELKVAGFKRGTLITIDYPNQIGGNLKRYFPEARISGGRYEMFVPPKVVETGQCYIVWNPVFGLIPGSWPSARNFAAKHYGVKSDINWPVKTIEAEIKRSGGRKAQLAYVVVPDTHKANCN